MLFRVYAQPLGRVVLEIVIGVVLWAVLGATLGRKKPRLWRVLNLCLLAVSAFAVLLMTVLQRTTGERELVLHPGNFLQEAKIQPEVYRSLLMNVLLFVPFGLALSAVLSRSKKQRNAVWMTVLLGLAFSILVESAQYFGGLGRAETDDVLANTFGTLLGALHLPLGRLLIKLKQRNKE